MTSVNSTHKLVWARWYYATFCNAPWVRKKGTSSVNQIKRAYDGSTLGMIEREPFSKPRSLGRIKLSISSIPLLVKASPREMKNPTPLLARESRFGSWEYLVIWISRHGGTNSIRRHLDKYLMGGKQTYHALPADTFWASEQIIFFSHLWLWWKFCTVKIRYSAKLNNRSC
jgi:hypothetical protein